MAAKLGITSLSLANIPPPMTQHEIDLPRKYPGRPLTAKDVAIDYQTELIVNAVVLFDEEIAMWSWDLQNSASPPKLEWRCNITRSDLAIDVASVLVSRRVWDSHMEDDLPQLMLPPSYILPGKDIQDFSTLLYSQQRDSARGRTNISENTLKKPIEFSLSESGTLLANSRVLAKGCTSFVETPAHLIYTTNQTLRFIHKTSEAEDLDVPPDETDERSRQIERGAFLITAMPSVYAVVLQMPRGNLETIYPRILVLAGVRRHVDNSNYKAAFFACRKQRIDMNILHDYDPKKFFDLAPEFVDQMKKLEYLDLFLSSLKEEDVSQTMYLNTLPNQASKSVIFVNGAAQQVSKVNKICDTLLKVLESLPSRVQNVITAYICKSPPDLDAALAWIAKIEDEQQIERAVEHICFLADVNHLFDHALGLYNLQLALQIAEQSQKDPREYMPFLERLQATEPEARRKFEIDDHLGRHVKALNSLYKYAAFEDVKKYVVRHDLYDQAVTMTVGNNERFLVITHLHAEHLQATAQLGKAGEAYLTTSDFSSASDCFRLAHRWQESLDSARRANFSPSQLDELAKILAEDLIESKSYTSAAYIHEHHLHDLPAAAHLHCRAHEFPSAEHVITLAKDPTLYSSILDEGLKTARTTISDLLRECTSQLLAQVPRILELREKKSRNPLAFLEGDATDPQNGDVDIPDNISLAPSDVSTAAAGGASLFTRYTGAQSGTVGTNVTRQTSKNKRREERKKARGKKGSVYEEEYLVNSVGRLIERVNSVHEDVEKIFRGLKKRDMGELGNALRQQLRDVIALCRKSIEVVFEGVEDVPVVRGYVEGGGDDGRVAVEDGTARSMEGMEQEGVADMTEKT